MENNIVENNISSTEEFYEYVPSVLPETYIRWSKLELPNSEPDKYLEI